MRQCPSCGTDYDVLDALCPKCGKELPAPYEEYEAAPLRAQRDPLDPDALTARLLDDDALASEQIILSGPEVMLGDSSYESGSVVMVRGLITEVLSFPIEEPADAAAFLELDGLIVSPGFVSLAPALPGTPPRHAEDFLGMARTAAQQGVTTLLPRIAPATAEELEAALQAFRAAQAQPSPGARLYGLRVDTPFATAGNGLAMPLDDPRAQAMLPLFVAYKDLIRMVTLAPDLPGAYDLIHTLRELGIIVSLGRSQAEYDDAIEAVEAGATHVANLYEAMPPLTPAAPGLAGAALERDELFTEFRCDSAIIHPAMVSILITAKGAERALPVAPDGNPLTAVRILVDDIGWDLVEALAMVSTTPALCLGAANFGAITLGAVADLVILDQELNPVATLVGGGTVWQRS